MLRTITQGRNDNAPQSRTFAHPDPHTNPAPAAREQVSNHVASYAVAGGPDLPFPVPLGATPHRGLAPAVGVFGKLGGAMAADRRGGGHPLRLVAAVAVKGDCAGVRGDVRGGPWRGPVDDGDGAWLGPARPVSIVDARRIETIPQREGLPMNGAANAGFGGLGFGGPMADLSRG